MPLFTENQNLMKLKGPNEQCCLECGRELYGRSDKKFCSLSCKNSFHNRIEQESKRVRAHTVRILDSNYRILEDLMKEKTLSATLEELEAIGYKSGIVSGFRTTGRGHYEMNCFDIRFSQSSSRIYNIRREITSLLSAPFQDPSSRQ